MKRKLLFTGAVFIVGVCICIIAYAMNWSSGVNVNTRNLENKLTHNLVQEQGQVKDLIDFSYDTVHIFEPYQPKESMELQIGFKFKGLKETVSEGMMNILFLNNNSPVAYLYGYPSNTGYYIELPVGTYTKIELDEMSYTATKCEVGNSAGTPQTYNKYVFDKN